MEIWIGDFFMWRAKRFIVFLLCMICAVVLTVIFDNDIIMLFGLILCGVIIELPFFKTKCLANVYVEDNKIFIETEKKKVDIAIKEITDVKMKDIKYGGKWLDIIGYRLIVVTNDKKYHFDSTFVDENDNDYNDIFKLQNMIKSSKAKVV